MSSLIVEVCEIEEILPHDNADTLEIACVKGWNCVVKIGDFNERDVVVFVPPDSILPPELIEKYNITYLKGHHGRIGTQKIRGYVSQGLILSISCLGDNAYSVGDDVSKVLGITKHDPGVAHFQSNLGKPSKMRPNPNFTRYTDIENIKNFPNVFQPGDDVVVLEKIHGTNFRAGYVKRYIREGWKGLIDKLKFKLFGEYEFVYGSHNVQIENKKQSWYDKDVYGKMAKKYSLMDVIPKGHVIYGEIYGLGIQDMQYGLNDVRAAFFDIKKDGVYLPFSEVERLCVISNLDTVPVLYKGKYYDSLVAEYTNGKSVLCPTQIREGCVIKSAGELNNPRVGRKILKSISIAYLLRKDGTEFK